MANTYLYASKIDNVDYNDYSYINNNNNKNNIKSGYILKI